MCHWNHTINSFRALPDFGSLDSVTQLITVSLDHGSRNPHVSHVSVYTKVCIITEVVYQMESNFSLEGDWPCSTTPQRPLGIHKDPIQQPHPPQLTLSDTPNTMAHRWLPAAESSLALWPRTWKPFSHLIDGPKPMHVPKCERHAPCKIQRLTKLGACSLVSEYVRWSYNGLVKECTSMSQTTGLLTTFLVWSDSESSRDWSSALWQTCFLAGWNFFMDCFLWNVCALLPQVLLLKL